MALENVGRFFLSRFSATGAKVIGSTLVISVPGSVRLAGVASRGAAQVDGTVLRNGKPFPDGAMMAKTHWMAKKAEDQPGEPAVPGSLHDIDFMVKDSKRFADSGGWGYAAFQYDPASATFRPSDTSDTPPQEHDAKCGFACHSIVETKDYVFTAYPNR